MSKCFPNVEVFRINKINNKILLKRYVCCFIPCYTKHYEILQEDVEINDGDETDEAFYDMLDILRT
jgi:hypothetical protein